MKFLKSALDLVGVILTLFVVISKIGEGVNIFFNSSIEKYYEPYPIKVLKRGILEVVIIAILSIYLLFFPKLAGFSRLNMASLNTFLYVLFIFSLLIRLLQDKRLFKKEKTRHPYLVKHLLPLCLGLFLLMLIPCVINFNNIFITAINQDLSEYSEAIVYKTKDESKIKSVEALFRFKDNFKVGSKNYIAINNYVKKIQATIFFIYIFFSVMIRLAIAPYFKTLLNRGDKRYSRLVLKDGRVYDKVSYINTTTRYLIVKTDEHQIETMINLDCIAQISLYREDKNNQ